MSAADREPLRIALLHHSYGSRPTAATELVRRLATALRGAGHRPCVVTSHLGASRSSVEDGVDVVRLRRLPEAPLRFRGFTGPLTQLPASLRLLLSGDYAVAHAFSPSDALAALLWRARVGRPAVFTPGEPVERRTLADRRLRLWLIQHAVEDSDAVIAPSEQVRSTLWRWLAVEADVIDPSDAAGLGRLYCDAADRFRSERGQRRGGRANPRRR